jgi:hypothetical protein
MGANPELEGTGARSAHHGRRAVALVEARNVSPKTRGALPDESLSHVIIYRMHVAKLSRCQIDPWLRDLLFS